MAFQLALIWGGYAFLAPRDLPQHKLWKSKLWQSIQREGMILKRQMQPEAASIPPVTATYDQPETAEADHQALAEVREGRRLNKKIIAHVFIVITILNISVHLVPFNYSPTLVTEQIARSIGVTIAIYIASLIGLTFKPSKTLGMAAIAILIAPVMILADRAHDPLAPRYFRDLFYPNDDVVSDKLQPEVQAGNAEATDNRTSIGNEAAQNIVTSADAQAIPDLAPYNTTATSSQETIPTARQFTNTIHNAVDKFSITLAEYGMTGAQRYSNSCRYKAINSTNILDTDYCIAFDMAAMSADVGIAETAGFPRNEYFMLRAKGIDGDYDRFSQPTNGRTEMIWKEVNSVLLTSIQSAQGGSE